MAAYADVKAPRYSQDHMVAAAKLLVLPILEASFDRGEDVVDGELLDAMVKHIFDAPDDLAGECQEQLDKNLGTRFVGQTAGTGLQESHPLVMDDHISSHLISHLISSHLISDLKSLI